MPFVLDDRADAQPISARAGTLRRRLMAVCAALALLPAGCSTVERAPNVASVKVVPGGPPTTGAYRLNVDDQINVKFQFYSDLNDTATIGPDGHVYLQLVNDVPIAGLTIADAAKLLNERYSQVLRSPSVGITVQNYALQQIYVDGQVGNPGVVRSTVPLTASRAIAQAGGLKLGTAATKQVLLIRRNQDGTVAYYELNFDGGVAGPDQDPLLQSYDVIYVPQTEIASVADFVSNNLLRMIPYSFQAAATHPF